MEYVYPLHSLQVYNYILFAKGNAPPPNCTHAERSLKITYVSRIIPNTSKLIKYYSASKFLKV